MASQANPGTMLEDCTWIEAEKILTPNTVVVIPLGAACKEHGPHLKLKNDFLLAEYLKLRVLKSADVVIAPTVNYSFYPAFAEYPGSTSLQLETAKNVVVDICRSLTRFGPRRFYVLNTGISTMRPLKLAAETLAKERVVLRYTDLSAILSTVEKEIQTQEGGTHADELETSMMLFMAPDSVDMTRSVKDYNPDKGSPLTRNVNGAGTYSPTGVWGDATLATREKGEKLSETLVKGILADIASLKKLSVD